MIAGQDMADAAAFAHNAALAYLVRLPAADKGTGGDVESERLEAAIGAVELAAIYELKRKPFGETTPLSELLAQASKDTTKTPSEG